MGKAVHQALDGVPLRNEQRLRIGAQRQEVPPRAEGPRAVSRLQREPPLIIEDSRERHRSVGGIEGLPPEHSERPRAAPEGFMAPREGKRKRSHPRSTRDLIHEGNRLREPE